MAMVRKRPAPRRARFRHQGRGPSLGEDMLEQKLQGRRQAALQELAEAVGAGMKQSRVRLAPERRFDLQ